MKNTLLEYYAEKHITVFGANRSGVAVSKLLHDIGSRISITDSRSSNELFSELSQLDGLQIQYYLGGHSEECINNTDIIVLSPGVPLDIPILNNARNREIPILGELEVSAGLCEASIIAITGTKGKSTTTLITAAILASSELFQNVVVAGNIGVPLASKVATITSDDIVVLEASSFQLEGTITFLPSVGVFLNFSRDHLDRHKTMKSYFNAKAKITANQSETDWIVLNAEDESVKGLANTTKAQKAFFTDSITDKDVQVDPQDIVKTGIGAYLRINGEEISLYSYSNSEPKKICDISELPLEGAHNIRNILAATVVGTIYEVKPIFIRNTILGFDPIHPAFEHAFEKIDTIDGIDFINDSKATNVIATYAAIESIGYKCNNNRNTKNIILIMGGYDKGNDYSSLIEPIKRKVKCMILLGEHTHNIQKAFRDNCKLFYSDKMEEAVNVAHKNAEEGDIVLLSPANASFDMYTDYKARGEAFNNAVHSLISDI